jgi:hypothetical protein
LVKKLIRGRFDLTALRQLKVTKTLLIRQASYLTRNSAEVKNVQKPANFQTQFVFVLCKLTATRQIEENSIMWVIIPGQYPGAPLTGAEL